MVVGPGMLTNIRAQVMRPVVRLDQRLPPAPRFCVQSPLAQGVLSMDLAGLKRLRDKAGRSDAPGAARSRAGRRSASSLDRVEPSRVSPPICRNAGLPFRNAKVRPSLATTTARGPGWGAPARFRSR